MREAALTIQTRLSERLGTSEAKASASTRRWRVDASAAHCSVLLVVKPTRTVAIVRGDLPFDVQVATVIKALGGSARVSSGAQCEKITVPIQHPYAALLSLAATFEAWPIRRQRTVGDRKYFLEAPVVAQCLRTAYRALAS